MKSVAFFVLIFALNAQARLGGPVSEIDKDLPKLANRSRVHHGTVNGCYTIEEIKSDGTSVRQFVNSSNNTVFMVRTNGRIITPIQGLMSTDDFTEYGEAPKAGTRAVRNLSRNRKNVETETSHLKIFVEDRQNVHRSVLISKANVPSCVKDAETLP